MELAAGMTLALFVSVSTTITGLGRERGFYPIVLIVIASYYALFAAMAGTAHILSLETLAMALFVAASLAGYKGSLWLVVTALLGHGVFDLVHAHLIVNPGVPRWWPRFCLGYDLVAAAWLGWLLCRSRWPVPTHSARHVGRHRVKDPLLALALADLPVRHWAAGAAIGRHADSDQHPYR